MGKQTKYAGTQTEKNLEAAFAGESQARNKYTGLRTDRGFILKDG